MPTANAWPERASLRKSQDAVQQIKERGARMIDRGDMPSGNRPLQQHLRASLPGAGYGPVSEHKADSLIAKFKEAGGTV